MTTNNFDYDEWEDRISAYLNDKMNDSDRIQFELDMVNMPELQEAVEFDKALKQQATERQLLQHLKPHLDSYVKEKFPDANTEMPSSLPKSRYPLSIKSILGILALITIIILSVIAYNNYQNTKYHSEMMVKWLSNAPLPYENTNLENFQTGMDSAAIQAYKQGNYIQAESLFISNDSKQNNAFGPRGLYRAINALLISPPKTDKAIEILKVRYENKNTFRYDAVEWYLALAYLQKKDFNEAKRILEDVSKDSEYATQAEGILIDLKQKSL